MFRTFFGAVAVAGLLAFGAGPLAAQEAAPTKDELTLRPGDKITWTPAAPHRVQFGGTGVTPFADVEAILENITPPLTADGAGVAKAGPGEVVTATVRADAAVDAEFNFTCGFPAHTPLMITVPFKVAASDGAQPRDVQIVSASSGPPRWILKAVDKTLSK